MWEKQRKLYDQNPGNPGEERWRQNWRGKDWAPQTTGTTGSELGPRAIGSYGKIRGRAVRRWVQTTKSSLLLLCREWIRP